MFVQSLVASLQRSAPLSETVHVSTVGEPLEVKVISGLPPPGAPGSPAVAQCAKW